MTEYEPVIGLEVHAELLTKSKMFCGCEVVDSTQAPPNTTVCPVCTAQPGTLPVINRQAIEYAMMVGMALNCQINSFNQFARKSYFYPDLPKGYQITQYEHPIATDGYLDVEADGQPIRIGITRAHIEEDTGKSTHMGDHSLIDLNRAGVPLLEIVSEPDIHSVEALEAYARKLRQILIYLGVNHGDMSKGVLRFEANVSVRPVGSDEFRTRTEIKNLNSIRSLVKSSQYEINRQAKIYESGGEVIQQTMGIDEETGATHPQRGKEHAHDYRYFPEPDLPPLYIAEDWIARIRGSLPELPDARFERFVSAFKLSDQDAGVLVADKAVADYYEAAVENGGDPQIVANWLTGELFRLMNLEGVEIDSIRVDPGMLVELLGLVTDGTINNTTAKEVLAKMFESGQSAAKIVEAEGLAQISDTGELEALVDQIVANSPDEVESYLGGKESLIGWFVGQVMKETRGQANAKLVNQLFRDRLNALRG